jgi:hypothetical protein
MKVNACRTWTGLLTGLATFITSTASSAAVAAQCELAGGGADGSGRVLAWNALRGGAAPVPAFGGSPAWAPPPSGRAAFPRWSRRPARPWCSGRDGPPVVRRGRHTELHGIGMADGREWIEN